MKRFISMMVIVMSLFVGGVSTMSAAPTHHSGGGPLTNCSDGNIEWHDSIDGPRVFNTTWSIQSRLFVLTSKIDGGYCGYVYSQLDYNIHVSCNANLIVGIANFQTGTDDGLNQYPVTGPGSGSVVSNTIAEPGNGRKYASDGGIGCNGVDGESTSNWLTL